MIKTPNGYIVVSAVESFRVVYSPGYHDHQQWLQRLAEAYDPEDTEEGKPAIDALRRADMDGYRNACGLDAALEGRE